MIKQKQTNIHKTTALENVCRGKYLKAYLEVCVIHMLKNESWCP